MPWSFRIAVLDFVFGLSSLIWLLGLSWWWCYWCVHWHIAEVEGCLTSSLATSSLVPLHLPHDNISQLLSWSLASLQLDFASTLETYSSSWPQSLFPSAPGPSSFVGAPSFFDTLWPAAWRFWPSVVHRFQTTLHFGESLSNSWLFAN